MPDALVRDSAGIRIVEHPADYQAPVWQMGAAPLTDIGEADGDETTLLFQVEGAHRLSDGRIAVANRSSHELRYYSPEGQYLFAAGREGAGPGEFGYIAWTARCGSDSVFTYDITNIRLSVFDPAGRFARSSRLEMPDGGLPYSNATCAHDGTFLVGGWASGDPQPGYHRQDMPLAVVGADGVPIRDLGMFPGVARWGNVIDGRLRGTGPLEFGRTLAHVMGSGLAYVGTSDTYEIRGYSVEGQLRLLIRKDVGNMAIAQADVDQYVAQRLSNAQNADQRRSWAEYYRGYAFPDSFPAYAAFHMDSEDNLWVEDYVRPSEPRHTWNVFAKDGVQIAAAEVPEGFTVFEIGDDYVLGKWQDELDIEHVQLYELLKPGRERGRRADLR
jgi:hypothetical protein